MVHSSSSRKPIHQVPGQGALEVPGLGAVFDILLLLGLNEAGNQHIPQLLLDLQAGAILVPAPPLSSQST